MIRHKCTRCGTVAVVRYDQSCHVCGGMTIRVSKNEPIINELAPELEPRWTTKFLSPGAYIFRRSKNVWCVRYTQTAPLNSGSTVPLSAMTDAEARRCQQTTNEDQRWIKIQ